MKCSQCFTADATAQRIIGNVHYLLCEGCIAPVKVEPIIVKETLTNEPDQSRTTSK